MTEELALPLNVQFELRLDSPIGATYHQYNEDGDFNARPMTVLDAIVVEVAKQLVAKVSNDFMSSCRDVVHREIKAIAAEKVAPLVDGVLNGSWPKTNHYGEPTGGAVTMRDLVLAEASAQLKQNTGRNSYDKTVFDKVLETTIASVIGKELVETVAAAKRAIQANVAKNAAEVIAAAIVKGVTG